MTPARARRLLEATSWAREPITYTEWVEAAGYHPRQSFTWRQHELIARMNYKLAGDGYDLGGES